MKVAVVTCHNQPNYIRAVTLRTAIAAAPGVQSVVIKNSHTGVLRYPEMIGRLLALRIRERPDAYVITFRGYEILPFAAVLTWPKTLIYDELVNPIEWLSEPRPELWSRFIPKSLLTAFYRMLLKRCAVVITDTDSHSRYSAALLHLPVARFRSVPVGTDETMFKPTPRKQSKPFRVFYYGNMLPLHGLDIVVKAAEKLANLPIEFVLVGGSTKMATLVQKAQQRGCRVVYQPWLAFEKIPEEIAKASLCLGGPFGNTTQASHVITGKTYQFLASGAPVLIGENKASELFIDKNNCLTTRLGDADKLAEAIQWAYDHPKELRNVARNGRKLYEEHFSSTSIAQKVAAILQA